MKGLDDVFAVGDIAYMATEAFPHGHPQLAQVAIQQARHLADNLNRDRWIEPFVYNDKGSMATVGRNLAVADLKHMHLYGWLSMAGMDVYPSDIHSRNAQQGQCAAQLDVSLLDLQHLPAPPRPHRPLSPPLPLGRALNSPHSLGSMICGVGWSIPQRPRS